MIPPASSPSASGDFQLIAWTALTIGVVFFMAEHDWQASLRETFAAEANEMQSSVSSGSLARRLAFPALALIGLVCCRRRPSVRLSGRGLLPWMLVAYLLWCLLSLTWSDDAALTGRRLITLGCFAFAAAALGTRLDLREICLVTLLVCGAFVATGVVVELLLGTFRPWLPDYRFAGTAHPNSQAIYCAVLCLASIAAGTQFPAHRFLWCLPIPAGCLLILTGSRTSCAALIVALIAFATARCSWRARATVGLVFILVSPFVLLTSLVADFDVIAQAEQTFLLGRDDHAETLTGRIPLWEELAAHVQARPWRGYGYNSFWDADQIYAISSTLKWGISDSHNAFLESLLSVGLIGTGMLLLIVLLAAQRAMALSRRTKLAGYDFVLALLVLGVTHGLLESGMILLRFVPFTMAVGISHLALRAPQEVDS